MYYAERRKMAYNKNSRTYDDVIVVSSVSCIYGIGDPDDYKGILESE